MIKIIALVYKDGKAYVTFSDGREAVEDMSVHDFIRITTLHTKPLSNKE